MKTLHLCTKVPFPAKDGGSVGITAFFSLLKSLDIHVVVLAANTPKHRVKALSDNHGVELHSVPVDTDIKLIHLIRNFFFSRKPYVAVRFQSDLYKVKLREILSGQKFDIIQLEGPHMGIYLSEIRRYSDAKVVLRAHNIEYRLWEEIAREPQFFLKRSYLKNMSARLKAFERNIISMVDGIIPVSENDLMEIQQTKTTAKHLIIPFGFFPEKYQQTNTVEEDTLFYIGALDWIPNQYGVKWFMEHVWPLVHKAMPTLKFHIAGRKAPGWLKEMLETDNVVFYGEVDDAISFINHYGIMVVPLLSGSGIRIKILEGMALGKAIVTTSKGAEGLNVTSGKELIIHDDPHDFSQDIVELVSDNSRRKKLSESAKAYIYKEFDNLALAKKIHQFYCSLYS